jgi:hypothetical protein
MSRGEMDFIAVIVCGISSSELKKGRKPANVVFAGFLVPIRYNNDKRGKPHRIRIFED